MNELKNYIGIDFGTTNSACVVITTSEFGSNTPKKLTDFDGGPFPSLIVIDKLTGEKYFGREAWQRRRTLSENCEVISSVKSYLGSDKEWDILGEKWNATKLTSEILKNLALQTQEKLNCHINDIVLAVPAGFSAEKRKALKEAARLSQIKVKSFVSEPTAAFYKHYSELKHFSKVAVFDWGGGTLDISILSNEKNKISELAIKSVKGGGDDIDLKLAKWVHSQVVKEKGINKGFDDMPNNLQDLLLTKSESAKRTLSDNNIAKISLNEYGEFSAINIQIDIDIFSKLIEPEVKKAIKAMEDSVSEAGLSINEIECVLMVGGSSKLVPLLNVVSERWEYIEIPDDAEWSVAEGASLLNKNPGEFKLNQELGLILCDGNFLPLMENNETLPCAKREKEFGIVEDNYLANFIFSDSKKIIGFINTPVYGFNNENIIVSYRINEDLVFRAIIKSDHRTKDFIQSFEYSNIKFNYKLPLEDEYKY